MAAQAVKQCRAKESHKATIAEKRFSTSGRRINDN